MTKDAEKGCKQENDTKSEIKLACAEITHPTNFWETLIHLFKGNIGPGLFAMGDAFKNGGVVLAPILTIFIAIVSVHCQHILLNCSKKVRELTRSAECPDYAETVRQCFELGPPKLRKCAGIMSISVNIFICVTQLGFCCIYFVFITSNITQILHGHEHYWNRRLVMLAALVPILLPCLITKLKLLSPVSMIANICMIFSLIVTMYYALKDEMPDIKERNMITNPASLALYFGTAIFAFEGIALVLPLKIEMKNPQNFDRPLGVLNVGMTLVTLLFSFAGFFGYWKWGDDVGGSLTLNLPQHWLADVVKSLVSLGVLLGYPLQFFVAILIMWPNVLSKSECKHPLVGELFFRAGLVTLTFLIAEFVPNLGLFISLIGALCSTTLALVFPPLIELILRNDNSKGPGVLVFIKNIIILLVALLGFATGTYESISSMIKEFQKD